MTFDWTVNLGNVVSLLVFLAAVYGLRKSESKDEKVRVDNLHKENMERLDKIEKQLDLMQKPWDLMWDWFRKEHGLNDVKN